MHLPLRGREGPVTDTWYRLPYMGHTFGSRLLAGPTAVKQELVKDPRKPTGPSTI